MDIVAVDTETNVTDTILDRVIKVVSLADVKGAVVCVIEWDYLSENSQMSLLKALAKRTTIYHNAVFDVKLFNKYGVVFEKIHCTMIGEQILDNGYSAESGKHGLQAVVQRRFNVDISKSQQLTFGEGLYDDDQILYAGVDVLMLGRIWEQQRQEMKNIDNRIRQKGNRGLRKTYWWEMEFAKVVIDMELTGLLLDKDRWYAAEDAIRPIYEQELASLNELVVDEYLEDLKENDLYTSKDTFDGNVWTSSTKKTEVLGLIFPELEKSSKVELKKYLLEHDPEFPEELVKGYNGKKWDKHEYPANLSGTYAILKLLIAVKDDNKEEITKSLDAFIINNFKEFLVEKTWLIPANSLTLNWASPSQRLKVFKLIDPDIESTGKDVIADYANQSKILTHYMSWADTEYKLKMFGKRFYDKHVDLDGRFRTRFRQILKTGRLGSLDPMLLNFPRLPAYRKAIVAGEGRELIGADYDGEELIITATLANETSWLEYLKKGYDLHSMNAALIFGDKWLLGQEEGCQYYAEDSNGSPKYHKCSCTKHMDMRDQSKAVSFGSIYGISKFKLSLNLKISEEEAEFILTRFFEIVPNIRVMMDKFAAYALSTGHIIEPVMGRIRFYDKWKLSVPEEHGSISRTAFNTPIQAAGSSLLKIALVLLRRSLIHKKQQKNIRILLPYHDEAILDSIPESVALGKQELSRCMMLSAKLGGFHINATSASGKNWYEIH